MDFSDRSFCEYDDVTIINNIETRDDEFLILSENYYLNGNLIHSVSNISPPPKYTITRLIFVALLATIFVGFLGCKMKN